MSKAAQFRLLVEGLLAHGAGEEVRVVDDPPIDLIGHLLVSLLLQIGEGGPLRMTNGVLQCSEPHGTEKGRIADVLHHRASLHLTTLELPIRLGRRVALNLKPDDHRPFFPRYIVITAILNTISAFADLDRCASAAATA